MNRIRILNCICYLGILLAYLFTGWIAFITARFFKFVFDQMLPGKPLPNITELMLAYGKHGTPLVVDSIIGLIFAVLLFYLEFGNEKRRAYLPLCLAAALALIFLQVSAVLEGVTMPFYFVTYGMSDARH